MRGLWIFLAVVGVAVAGYMLVYPSVTLRYRLTLEATTPQGLKTGSGVVQVRYRQVPQLLGSTGDLSIAVKGEAVALDLGGGRVLFALLREGGHPRSGAEYIIPMAYGLAGGSVPRDFLFGSLRALRGERALRPDQMPMLVTFGDLSDPKSVEAVDPADLAASFGAGVTLKRITVAITDDPVTTGIEKRLGWLVDPGLTLDPDSGPTTKPTLAQRIRQAAFWQGAQ